MKIGACRTPWRASHSDLVKLDFFNQWFWAARRSSLRMVR